MKRIRILLVDDHAVVRQALRALLSSQPDLVITGEAENGWQAVTACRELQPDIVLMDLAMPGLSGLEASRQILSAGPGPKIIVLSSYSDDQYVKETIRAGVSGYLAKKSAAQELIKAIREVYAGAAYFSPDIARRLRDQSRQAFGGGTRSIDLTRREEEVLTLIARSFSNKQIGAALGISVKTVEKHRQQVMNKLHIHDVAGLTLYAANKGLVEVPGSATPPEHSIIDAVAPEPTACANELSDASAGSGVV